MIGRRRSLGFTLAATYAAICLLAVSYVIFGSLLGRGGEELAGLLVLSLSLPWSLAFTFLIRVLGSSSAWLLALSFGLGFLINGWLLYRLGARRTPAAKGQRGD